MTLRYGRVHSGTKSSNGIRAQGVKGEEAEGSAELTECGTFYSVCRVEPGLYIYLSTVEIRLL